MKDHESRATFFISAERREWHDPEKVLERIGITKGMVLADLGSGPGFFTIPMARLTGETGIVYAVDSSPTMLKHLLNNIAKSGVNKNIIKIVDADICKTAIPEKSVDVAFFANVLHEVEDKTAFLQEVKRICKITASVVDVDWKKVPTEHGPPLKIRLTEEESSSLFSENGFVVTRQLTAGPNHYELICKLSAKTS
jgi:ubiquinone/menaquinone biosynthesis C-methylase UbiE